MNKSGQSLERWGKIVGLVDDHGYLSVKELGHLCSASEITIRRDLEILAENKRILRTHGGAASLKGHALEHTADPAFGETQQNLDRLDALITSSSTDNFFSLVPEKFSKRFLPVIAEAIPLPNAITCVAIDNYAAGKAIGQWAGAYVNRCWGGKAYILDLTYHLPNTVERSRGFIDGLQEVAGEGEILFSLNSHSRHETAYQLTKDAIATDARINVIFAINDQSALGAIRACRELRLDPQALMVIPFGLEGSTMRSLLAESPYCRGGLAMFPEIVARICLEATIAAYNHQTLPAHVVTPYAVVEKGSLEQYYRRAGDGWKLRPDAIERLILPMPVHTNKKTSANKTPRRVGIAISFWEHEWYKNLCASLVEYGRLFGIEIEFVDAKKTIQDEIEQRRREIAAQAAQEVHPGEVVFIDASPIAGYLAESICERKGITVITNSMPVQERLKNCPDITLIGTGGVLRISSQAFVGPTAEHAIREMRVDRLFLTVSGVSVNFGLSHTNISEVTIKQTMIKSAREVILLADHSMFESESTVQVAPLNAIHQLITDDALPASARVQISQMGVQVVVAGI